MEDRQLRFKTAIGQAALDLWPDLPRHIQERLFEYAVITDGSIREPLAIYLHDHHPRTAHPPQPSSLA